MNKLLFGFIFLFIGIGAHAGQNRIECMAPLDKDLRDAKIFGTFSHPTGSKSYIDLRPELKALRALKEKTEKAREQRDVLYENYHKLSGSTKNEALVTKNEEQMAKIQDEQTKNANLIEAIEQQAEYDSIGESLTKEIKRLRARNSELEQVYLRLANQDYDAFENLPAAIVNKKELRRLQGEEEIAFQKYSAKYPEKVFLGKFNEHLPEETYSIEPDLKQMIDGKLQNAEPGLRAGLQQAYANIVEFQMKHAAEISKIKEIGGSVKSCAWIENLPGHEETLKACMADLKLHNDKIGSKEKNLVIELKRLYAEYNALANTNKDPLGDDLFDIYYRYGNEEVSGDNLVVYLINNKISSYRLRRGGKSYEVLLNEDCTVKTLSGDSNLVGVRNLKENDREIRSMRCPSESTNAQLKALCARYAGATPAAPSKTSSGEKPRAK